MGRSRLKRSAHAISPRTEHGFLGCCCCSVCLYGEKHLNQNLPTLVMSQSGLPSLRDHLTPFLQNSCVSSVRAVAEADLRSLTAPHCCSTTEKDFNMVTSEHFCIVKKRTHLSPLTGLTLDSRPIFPVSQQRLELVKSHQHAKFILKH